MDFIEATTKKGGPDFVPPEERIVTLDQDGTLWVEHPMTTQLLYCLDRVPKLVQENPDLRNTEPFKTALTGDLEAIAKLPLADLYKIALVTLTGMPVEQFKEEVQQWIATAKDKRWKRLYTELTYLPMKEVLNFLRANGYKTYIVTAGMQDFVRVYSQEIYGIPPEQVIGTAARTSFEYGQDGKPFLRKDPELLLRNNYARKPEGIYLMIGRRPVAAIGNSNGDQQMVEYAHRGNGRRLAMLILHDDPKREYAYGPAQGLPNTKFGTFSQALYDEAKKGNWVIISMKNDWKRIFSFD